MQENRAWNRLKDEELIETLKLMEASEIYPAKAQKVYEELYNIPYMKKLSPIFTKTILERTYLLDRWIFCL